LQRAREVPQSRLEHGPSGRGVFPPVNLFSDEEGYTIRLEVPGLAPENFTIDARDSTLRISGKREDDVPADASVHRRERWSGEFARSVQLPDELDLSKAEASYKHGILSIRVPRREESKPRQITVKVS
jgi:HSP20 family protein